jgi:hypothetical protein
MQNCYANLGHAKTYFRKRTMRKTNNTGVEAVFEVQKTCHRALFRNADELCIKSYSYSDKL